MKSMLIKNGTAVLLSIIPPKPNKHIMCDAIANNLRFILAETRYKTIYYDLHKP